MGTFLANVLMAGADVVEGAIAMTVAATTATNLVCESET